MSTDPTNHRNHREASEAELPRTPPGAPEGHDAAPANGAEQPSQADAAPEQDAAAVATEPGAPAESAEPEAESAEPEAESAEPVQLTDSELETLSAKAAKADEYLSLAQRTQADFENYRRRATRDAAAAQERGAVKLAVSLLPAVDNLERALDHAPEDADSDHANDFVAGIRHVHSDVVDALRKAGIERYSPEGEAFDPTLHEAVAQQPIDGAEPGTVVEVYQRGYRMGETVVRPARVVVAG